jgi:hypothetical protein
MIDHKGSQSFSLKIRSHHKDRFSNFRCKFKYLEHILLRFNDHISHEKISSRICNLLLLRRVKLLLAINDFLLPLSLHMVSKVGTNIPTFKRVALNNFKRGLRLISIISASNRNTLHGQRLMLVNLSQNLSDFFVLI